ncbi:hypothetical protein ACLK2F_05005 [Escherichia coli]
MLLEGKDKKWCAGEGDGFVLLTTGKIVVFDLLPYMRLDSLATYPPPTMSKPYSQ